jgi:UDP-N-acetylglucosamine--N-acetylmuramyl-(pentapeptide) pyrophosphoryl-undecaprenol N-acetylglucosamine transferase
VVGVPLRAGFGPQAYATRASGKAPAVSRVLVMGGSQGAQALNERLPWAIARARADVPEIEVVHQAGRGRDGDVREAYRLYGLEGADVRAFLDDVPREIARADVVVARSGASTVAEIAAVGRAAILIPFPHAADDHQAKNAESLATAGGAVALRQESADPVRIAAELVRILKDDTVRGHMAAASRGHGMPHAAEDVARDLLGLAGVALSPPKPRHVNGTPANPEVR